MSNTTLVGLDIGSTSIRAVEATVTKDRTTITHYAVLPLPAGAVVAGVVKDARAVTASVRTLWTSAKFKTKNVVVGLMHQQVVVRETDIVNLPARDRKQALPFLVRDALPLPVDECVLDFFPLEEGTTKDTVRGLVIAAPKDPVLALVRAVEDAGLHVVRVDLSCFAVLRASAHLADDTEALIDIGAEVTTIIVHTNGVPKIVRTIGRGGSDITALLAQRLGMSRDDAEVVKCRVGLRRDEGNEGDASEAAAVIAEALRPLINEIRGSLNYLAATETGSQVARVALVGGAAQLPGLAGLLTEQLRIPAFLSDPLQRVSDSVTSGRHDTLTRHRSSAAVSVGLTLGAA